MGDSRRLDSIKAAHRSERKKSSSRTEDYLEVISELVELKGYATTLDISRYMHVSAPSVTKMLQRLDEGGYLEYEKYHGIKLTARGSSVAESVRQRHGILLEFLEMIGVGYRAANRDAEGIEHHLDPTTLAQLRKFITFLRANPKIAESFRNL
ncbi:MAG: transcriptional regulator [Nitrosopumilus sp.]|nr:transcriptional regulator [Nitrosopumilus sp.]CAI9831423.1 Transcriptional regulator MntR [Nitrosopumilaceae archaeon]MDA7940843.1 transcriptional regulator [Nitrosopumilus sp.]MDA7943301.1 transcriptional regulator [Nitrosopumilus sp.]MDA7944206.1 transcriptional regulator [Nitrosopumilus sp.]